MVVVPRFLAAGLLTFTLSGNAFAAPHRQRSLLPQDAYWDAKCKGDVTDPGKSPQTQWAAAKSSLALAAANHFWNNDPASQGSEVQISYIDDLLKLWDSKLGHEDCNLVDNSCNFDSLQCTDLPHPGAWQILKSIANFHTFWLNIYNSMQNAHDNINAAMGQFVSTFAPQAPEKSLIDTFLANFEEASINFVMGQALGPLSEILKPLGEAADATQSAITGGLELIKDQAKEANKLPEEMPADQKKDTLWGTLQGIVDTHHNIIANFVGNMVSGKAVYLGAFSKQIENGKWLTNNLGDKNLYDLEKNYKTAFSALLLADAWKLAYKSTPVVLMVDKQCDLSKPVREMTDDALQSGGSCVAGGKTLFLVGYNSDSCKSAANVLSPGSPVPCATGVFNKLPGFDNLGDYGLAKDNILASVWDAYQLNGGKNGYKFDPNTKIIDGIGTQSNMVLGGGIQTPGLYNIPICEVNEAVENYRNNLGGRLCDYGS